ncbi:ARM repeat superfamily protein isoform X2 [Wolffia australiana]
MAASSSSSGLRLWRTSFLSLRDEALAAPPPASLCDLLNATVLSHPPALLGAAALNLPAHEVLSDVVFLAEVGSIATECDGVGQILLQICRLIQSISCKARLQISTSSWITVLDFFGKIIDYFCGKTNKRIQFSSTSIGVKCLVEIVEILRCISMGNGVYCLSSDCIELTNLLLRIILCSYHGIFSQPFQGSFEKSKIGQNDGSNCNLWKMHAVAFSIIIDFLSRNDSSLSADMCQKILEVLRELLDAIATRKTLVEGYDMSRFYATLLDCLHLVLSNPKVAGSAVALKIFLTYGVNYEDPSLFSGDSCSKERSSCNPCLKSRAMEEKNILHARYIPPHLRKTGNLVSHTSEVSKYDNTTSDSDLSDGDRTERNNDKFRCSKTRISALICIQDICRSNPSSLTSFCGMLLPINDVLQPRKRQVTLMSCLLFDPVLKARNTAASTLSTILELNFSVFLQVAEYKETSKCGSFTSLSSSLGLVLLQIHRGILHLIKHEANGGLLASVFKILSLMISATPLVNSIFPGILLIKITQVKVSCTRYSRMPGDLLPTVITTILERICKGLSPKGDQTTHLGMAFSCLAAALATSPSQHLSSMIEKYSSQDVTFTEKTPSILSVIFRFCGLEVIPTVRFEALQALRVLLHNYPKIATDCWEDISANVQLTLQNFLHEESKWKDPENRTTDPGNVVGLGCERAVMAAIKVLDEGLRAISGFQGADDLSEYKLFDARTLWDCKRTKKVSSAPSHESNLSTTLKEDNSLEKASGVMQWNEVIEKHLPLVLVRRSAMVRVAGLTCFAGMTSSVFFILDYDKRQFIINSLVFSAINDEIPSVKSAACRGIGVISCFPQLFSRSEVTDRIVNAVELNIHDSQISVRIASSWALANICDSLRHKAADMHSDAASGHVYDCNHVGLLLESALRLSKDSDKIRSNAVRALGNLSRFLSFPNDSINSSGPISCWLERMVNAFVSCVTTGNVKVQWNVCHALGNLFLNKSLKLQDVSWTCSVYSVLILLLRDSTNFKIRIHAAAALAVPESRADYGSSFSDILQSLEHVLESLASEQVQDPSSFKYRDALKNQLTLTTLHLLGLGSLEEDQALKDFLTKKSSFLEQWLSSLWHTLQQMHDRPEDVNNGSKSCATKKQMISRAAHFLSEVYTHAGQIRVSQKLEKIILGLA